MFFYCNNVKLYESYILLYNVLAYIPIILTHINIQNLQVLVCFFTLLIFCLK